jgi:hypothetical protein
MRIKKAHKEGGQGGTLINKFNRFVSPFRGLETYISIKTDTHTMGHAKEKEKGGDLRSRNKRILLYMHEVK